MTGDKGLHIYNISITNNQLQINYKSGGGGVVKYYCSKGSCIKSNKAGRYNSLSDCEKACCKATYNCIDNVCVKASCDNPGDYYSFSDCEKACCKATYNCIDNVCVKASCDNPGDYYSFSDCEKACCKATYNCIDNVCVKASCDNPGDYYSFSDCEKACCKVTYNCINNSCVKASCNNKGIYNSLSDCEANCKASPVPILKGDKTRGIALGNTFILEDWFFNADKPVMGENWGPQNKFFALNNYKAISGCVIQSGGGNTDQPASGLVIPQSYDSTTDSYPTIVLSNNKGTPYDIATKNENDVYLWNSEGGLVTNMCTQLDSWNGSNNKKNW